jgi:hypothetical protein
MTFCTLRGVRAGQMVEVEGFEPPGTSRHARFQVMGTSVHTGARMR